MKTKILDPKKLEDNAFTALESLASFIEPPVDMTVSEFSERYITLPSDTAKPGSFVPFPYQVEMLDSMADPSVETVTLMMGAQTGKSQMFLNTICYYIAVRPSNIILLLPTADDVATMKTTKLDALLETTKGVRERVAKPRARGGKNNNSIVTFTGGALFFSSANAARTLRSRSVPIVMLDEISGFPQDTGEGSPITIVKARTKTFGDRKKIIQTSTPTAVGDAIHNEFLAGDQRYFFIPCPHCGESQTLEFENLRIDKDVNEKTGDIIKWHPETAYYAGKCCGVIWTDSDKVKACKKGEWVATAESTGHRSYQLNELYSPFIKWKDTAKAYVSCRRTFDMQSFYNTNMGLPWEEEAVKVDANSLMARAKRFDADDLPAQIVMLTTGTDVQADRIETTLVGWGKNEESYVLEHVVFIGDPIQRDVWDQLKEYLFKEYAHPTGRTIKSTVNIVDSGYLSPSVYAFCQMTPKTLPSKGASSRLKSLFAQSKAGPSGSKLVTIDTVEAKMNINKKINLVDKPNSPEIHFSDVLEDEWYLQFTAEKMVRKVSKGRVSYEFLPIRKRNEALDCYVYAYVGMKLAAPKGMRSRHNIFYRGIEYDEFIVNDIKQEEEKIKSDPHSPLLPAQDPKSRRQRPRSKPTTGFWK